MHPKTRIIVLHMKEILYTGIFLLLGILFVVLLVIMFSNHSKPVKEDHDEALYVPGVYHTLLSLGGSNLELEVVLDENKINSISLTNQSDAITTMYPLASDTLEQITNQILNTQSVEQVILEEDARYTGTLFLDAISQTLNKAKL